MRSLGRLNIGQRVAVLVAWTAALATVRWWLVVDDVPAATGWTSYAPMSQVTLSSPVGHRWTPAGSAAITLALIVLWLAVALWVLGERRPPGPAPDDAV